VVEACPGSRSLDLELWLVDAQHVVSVSGSPFNRSISDLQIHGCTSWGGARMGSSDEIDEDRVDESEDVPLLNCLLNANPCCWYDEPIERPYTLSGVWAIL
jgi:hypothetical protein